MILYVNGDSHSGGCEALSPRCFLQDSGPGNFHIDSLTKQIWKDEANWAPDNVNLNVSYGRILANLIQAELHCHARAAGSNDRIIRTTNEYLENFTPDCIVIGWSTWEREEWYNEDDGEYYQVNSSGEDTVPNKWKDRYKNFILNIDWDKKTIEAHEKIWQFHNNLQQKGIPHLFFNCHSTFGQCKDIRYKYNWEKNYLYPYDDNFSYVRYLISKEFTHTKSFHFGADAHKKWADFLYPHLTALL